MQGAWDGGPRGKSAETRNAILQDLTLPPRRLASQTTRYWLLSGAAVLLFGLLLGWWLPRVRWQRRRSGYDFS